MCKLMSLVFGSLFILTTAGFSLSCSKNDQVAPFIENRPEKPSPSPDPESPDHDDEKTNYQWFYKGVIDEYPHPDNLKDCPTNFSLDGSCEIPMSECKRKINIYSCYPENLEVRITGKVLDENNLPIENVKINGSLGYDGYNEYGTAFTKKNGSFILKIVNSCVPLIFALKDSYTNNTGKPHTSALTQCKIENFAGANNLVLRLKKSIRTINNIVEPISEQKKCRIVGRVADSNGVGLPGVNVFNGKSVGESDQHGIYTLEKNEKCDNYCFFRKKNYTQISPEEGNSVSCYQGRPADVIFKANNK